MRAYNKNRKPSKKIKTSDITVVQKIDYIKLYCPHCKEEILYNYDEFYEEIAEEMCDWKYKKFGCKECGEFMWDGEDE